MDITHTTPAGLSPLIQVEVTFDFEEILYTMRELADRQNYILETLQANTYEMLEINEALRTDVNHQFDRTTNLQMWLIFLLAFGIALKIVIIFALAWGR